MISALEPENARIKLVLWFQYQRAPPLHLGDAAYTEEHQHGGRYTVAASLRQEHEAHAAAVAAAAAAAAQGVGMRGGLARFAHTVSSSSDVSEDAWDALFAEPLPAAVQHAHIAHDVVNGVTAHGAAMLGAGTAAGTGGADVLRAAVNNAPATALACAPESMRNAPLDAAVAAMCANGASGGDAMSALCRTIQQRATTTHPSANPLANNNNKKALRRGLPEKPSAVEIGPPQPSTIGEAFDAALGIAPSRLRRALAEATAADETFTRRAAAAVHDALADPCDAAALAASVSCTAAAATQHSAAAASRCGAALSTLASKHCSARSGSAGAHAARCVHAAVDALPCSSTCRTAMSAMTSPCGGVMPRSEVGFHPADSSVDECEASVSAAQEACGNSNGNGNNVCAQMLHATPPDAVAAVGAVQNRVWSESHPRHTVYWSDGNARGVIPAEVACADTNAVHADLRGNNFLGAVPACVWHRGVAGTGAVHISRNRLSGSIAAIGPDVHTITAGDNKLRGDLAAALGGQLGETSPSPPLLSLTHLDLSRNRIHGTLDALPARAPLLRHLAVAHNALTDSAESAGSVASVLAAMPNLDSYDITGNAFVSHKKNAAADLGASKKAPTSLQVVLRMRAPVAHFCPHCDSGMHGHNCGIHAECRSRPKIRELLPVEVTGDEAAMRYIDHHLEELRAWDASPDHLAALQCTLERAAETGAGGGKRVTRVRLLRTMPAERDTVVSFVIDAVDAEAATAAAAAIRRMRDVHAHAGVSSSGGADASASSLGPLPIAAGCAGTGDAPHVGAVHDIDVRPVCGPGQHGSRCQYSCRTQWQRFSDEVVDSRSFSAQHSRSSSPAALPPGAQHQASSRQLLSSTAVVVKGTPPVLGMGGRNANSAKQPPHPNHVEPHMHQFLGGGAGTSEEPLRFHTKGCAIACRGYTNLALDSCHAWADAAAHTGADTPAARARRTAAGAKLLTCRSHLSDMQSHCGLNFANGDCGSASSSSKSKKSQNSEWTAYTATAGLGGNPAEEECEVCGVYRYLKQYGLFGAVPKTVHVATALAEAQEAHSEREQEANVRSHRFLSSGAHRTEAHAVAAHLGSTSFSAASGNDANPARSDHDLSAVTNAALAHEEERASRHFDDLDDDLDDDLGDSRSSTLSLARDSHDALNSQFPTCSVPSGCAHECTAAAKTMMHSCMAWIDVDVDAAANARVLRRGCGEQLASAEQACGRA